MVVVNVPGHFLDGSPSLTSFLDERICPLAEIREPNDRNVQWELVKDVLVR
jgi:hypothetical protein